MKMEGRNRKRNLSQSKAKDSILNMINKLKNLGMIKREELFELFMKSTSILGTVSFYEENQPTVLRVTSPLTIVGDIHGQFYDMLGMFEMFGFPPGVKYLFLGDYVDRGSFSVEVMILLLHLKVTYPQNIFLLRGNHQGRAMTSVFSFKFQCTGEQIQVKKNTILAYMKSFSKYSPKCLYVPLLIINIWQFMQESHLIYKQFVFFFLILEDLEKIYRFCQIEHSEPFFDLLWSDPSIQNTKNWTKNTDRNCSFFYSPIQAKEFLDRNKLQMIIRAHEVSPKGFKYQYQPNSLIPLTLTVFSAPNYCGVYGNQGSVITLSVNGQISIRNFRERPIATATFPLFTEAFEISLPMICANVGKIFKYLLKKTYSKTGKKRTSTEKVEDAKVLLAIEQFENEFSRNENEIKHFLNDFTRQESVKIEEHIEVSYQDLVAKIVKMKIQDEGQKFPINFGPNKHGFYHFGNLHQKMSQLQEETAQQELE